jgi:3-phosphoshikimate 1-carboxyvinyltransferase
MKPVNSTVSIPGSKSVTNRALILSALASSPSILHKPLRSRDTELMMQGLRALGVEITEQTNDLGEETWKVTPAVQLYGPASIDVGNAGTVMRPASLSGTCKGINQF